MISACKIVGFKMTHAKLAIFIEAEGFDADEGTPLVKIIGPHYQPFTMHVRLPDGSVDIRRRPRWDAWGCKLRVRFDADIFTAADIANLLSRAGLQVGICEGRHDSRNSAGMGWGEFMIESKEDASN
jgi:hypothetical protein